MLIHALYIRKHVFLKRYARISKKPDLHKMQALFYSSEKMYPFVQILFNMRGLAGSSSIFSRKWQI